MTDGPPTYTQAPPQQMSQQQMMPYPQQGGYQQPPMMYQQPQPGMYPQGGYPPQQQNVMMQGGYVQYPQQGYPQQQAYPQGYGQNVTINVTVKAPDNKPKPWSTAICNCCADCQICAVTCIAPCYQSALNKANADKRACTASDCLCCPNEIFTRMQIQAYYNIDEPCPCHPVLVIPCVICQDARELKIQRRDQYNVEELGLPPAPEPQQMISPNQGLGAPIPGQFTSGLFDCTKDLGFCIFAGMCVCCAIAFNKADVDGRNVTCFDVCCAPSEWFVRRQLRAKWRLAEPLGTECMTCLWTHFCLPCATCQDHREIVVRRNADRTAPSAGVAMTGVATTPQYS